MDTALIAVFWTDVDTRGSGEVFYRQTNDSHSVANATENIREAFEDADEFVPTTLFIATWKRVGYYDRNTYYQVCTIHLAFQVRAGKHGIVPPQTNTFQCVLATDGDKSYVILQYADLKWAVADSCSGSGIGSGSGIRRASSESGSGSGIGSGRIGHGSGSESGSGIESDSGSGSGSGRRNENECAVSAQVSFSAGNGIFRYYTLNGSGSEEALILNSTSNVNRPGVWIFQVDGDEVISGGKSITVSERHCLYVLQKYASHYW